MTNLVLIFLIIFETHLAQAFTCESLFSALPHPSQQKSTPASQPPTAKQAAQFEELLKRIQTGEFRHKEIKKIPLRPEQYYRLAIAAAKIPVDTSLGNFFDLKNYRGLSPDQIFEIAMILAANNSFTIARNISDYKRTLNKDQLFQVATTIADHDGWSIASFITDFGGFSSNQLLKIFKTAYTNESIPRNKLTIAVSFSELLPQEKIREFLSPLIISEHDYEKLSHIQKISELKKFFSDNTQILRGHSDILNLAWDRVQKRETGLRIIEEALRLVVRKKNIPRDSLELLSQISGLKLDHLRKDISSNSLGRIYELIFDIQNNLYGPFFLKTTISSEVYKNTNQFIQFLTIVRDIKSIYGNQRAAALKTLELIKNKVVDDLNISNLLSELRSHFMAELKIVLNSQQIDFTYIKIADLMKKWDDLEPIFTLIARLQGNPTWRITLPLLAEIIDASLNDSFEKLKFKGSVKNKDQIEKQLSGLKTEKALEMWRMPRTLVNIISKVDALPKNNILQNVYTNFKKTLLLHLQIEKNQFIKTRENLDFIISSKTNAKTTYENILLHLKVETLDLTVARKILFELISHFESLKINEVIKVLHFLKYLFHENPLLIELQTKEQMDVDLNSLLTLATTSTRSYDNQGLALTVFNSDPKFMLTIGELVNKYSCLNYRTGTFIQTLLGYTLDANVQAIASFVLEASQFETPTDFQKVFESYQTENIPVVHFDGNLLRAKFTLNNGEIIETLHLDSAFLRQIVKLGENKIANQAALFLETEYLQTHAAIEQLRQQHQILFNNLLQETHATNAGPITVYGSINPLGQYSDLAGGVKLEDYEVTPQ